MDKISLSFYTGLLYDVGNAKLHWNPLIMIVQAFIR